MSSSDRNASRRQRLAELSDAVLTSSGYIAAETDRWFLGAVRGAQLCVDRTKGGVARAGQYITEKTWVSRLPGVRKKTPSERMRRAILREAKRAGIRPEDPEFHAFAERIAVLLELVLEGSIAASAIDFEEGAESLEPEMYAYSESADPRDSEDEGARP
jgi:hypothetical protein